MSAKFFSDRLSGRFGAEPSPAEAPDVPPASDFPGVGTLEAPPLEDLLAEPASFAGFIGQNVYRYAASSGPATVFRASE